MSLLAASCVNAAIGLFQSGAVLDSAAYFWTARDLGGSQEADGAIRVLLSQLPGLVGQALAAGNQAAAQQLDSLEGLFDPERRARLTPEQAERRSLERCNDAAAALAQGGLERAAALCLAAAAYDPEGGLIHRYRDATIAGLLARKASKQAEGALEDATLALALAVALGARDQRIALMDVLEPLGDFQTIERLCEVMVAEDALSFQERFDAYLRGQRAGHRLKGLDAATAEALAADQTREWLVAQGPAHAVDGDVLALRVTFGLGFRGYRQSIEDLREQRRRRPDDPWIAHNLCAIVHNVLDPDVATAVETAMGAVTDDLEDLEQSYAFMWSMGAMPQALALADRLARDKPGYAAIAALYEMANDLDAAPAVVMGERRPGLPPLYANLACWGERYLELMEEAAIASLLSEGNFPALAKKADVVLELYSTASDIPRLIRSLPLRRLAAYCEIRIHQFPDVVAANARYLSYAVLGYVNHATILRAERDGAGLIFLLPDVLYADGCYAAIADRITEKPYAAFSDGLNAFRAPVMEAMQPFVQQGVLTAPPAALIDAGARFPTLRTTHSFYQPGDLTACSQLTRVMFPTAEGIRSHGFMILPAYVSHAAFAPMKIKSFATMDGVFTEHVLNQLRDEEIEMICAPEFAFVEICDDDGNVYPMLDKPLKQGVRDYFMAGGFNRRRYRLFRRPVLFPTLSPPAGGALIDAAEIEERLQEVRDLFAHDPHIVDIDEAQQRIRDLHYRR